MKLFLCASLAVVALCLPSPSHLTPPQPTTTKETNDAPVQELFFTDQSLDHFDAQNQATWSQRYFMRSDYYKAGGPVFLCVGGEGPPLTPAVLSASVHCNDAVELAATVGAMLFAVEHRFYGKSLPTPDFTTENLVYLSAHQALADLSTFHAFAVQQYGLEGAKWVSFGGSYPGMLSGWFRYKFPHLVHASVSSSSPVQAQLEFKGYNDVVAASMSASIVGGSQDCLDVITQGHAAIGALLNTTAGRATVTKAFNICNATALEDPNNQADWAGQGVVYLPVQENDPACQTPQCNISGVCTFLLDAAHGATPMDRLAALSAAQNGGSCVDVDHQVEVDALLNTTIDGGVDRIWTYQTCSEFAFYQTCDVGSDCPYTQGLSNLESYTHLCQIAYGIQPATIANRVAFSLGYWGGDNLQGSRILFPNGSIDPWHYLGVLKSPNADEPTLWVDGASHHFWTHPSLPTDSPQVVAAREAIWKQVTAWLAED